MVTDDLRIGTLVRRIQLNGHCEIRYSTSKFSSALIHTGTVVICDAKVYQINQLFNKLTGILSDRIIEEVVRDVKILPNTSLSLEILLSILKQLLSL